MLPPLAGPELCPVPPRPRVPMSPCPYVPVSPLPRSFLPLVSRVPTPQPLRCLVPAADASREPPAAPRSGRVGSPGMWGQPGGTPGDGWVGTSRTPPQLLNYSEP